MKNSIKTVIYSLIVTMLLLGSDYLINTQISLFSILLFFMLILYLATFFKNAKYIYLIIAIFGLIHHIFFSYFQRLMSSADVYNFFTHINETFETLFALSSLFLLPIGVFLTVLITLWLLNKIKIKKHSLAIWIKYPLLFILLYVNLNTNMGLKVLDTFSVLPMATNTKILTEETPIYPVREEDINIILILGESMKYNNYVEKKLKKQKHFYKKIYAGATNTDISLPLLLNMKNNTLKLQPNNQTNLFKLAKKSNFTTAFISMQSENSLRYIKPYLQLHHVDTYKSFGKNEAKPKFDFFLLNELEKLDIEKKSFVVLQQIGQHSPYKFFEGKKSNNPSINYQKSVDYSFEFYSQIYTYLIQGQKPFVLIYTSDHGEFSGENDRYGHNSFESLIYEVPMFITSNIALPTNYQQIKSHYELSQFLVYLLGYKEKLIFNDTKTIVNGTMLTREDGFIIIKY